MKKVLFIQPYYFNGGHYYELFNNLIKKLYKLDYYDFLVSINNFNQELNKDFEKIKKIKKIKTFNSSRNVTSIYNIVKSFFKILFLRKKYSVFFYYDGDLTIFSVFYFSSHYLWGVFYSYYQKNLVI